MSYTYKTKGDHARALLLEGTSARDAAKTTGMAEGTINLYFYKLKSKGDVDGTPGKPKPTAQSEKALKYLRIEKKVDVNQAKELQETAKDILSRLGNLPQKEAEAPAPVAKEDVSLAETIKEKAGLVLDQLDDLKKEKATEPTPAPAAPKADPKTPAFKKAPYTAPLGLKPLEVEAKKQTGLHDTTVKQVIRLLRGGGIPSGVATLANAPIEHIDTIYRLLVENHFIGERELYTKPVTGLRTMEQLSIEKRLIAKGDPTRISIDMRLDIKYIHRIEKELIELGRIVPSRGDIYGEDQIQEAKKMLSQGRSVAVVANLMLLPAEIVKDLEEERLKEEQAKNGFKQSANTKYGAENLKEAEKLLRQGRSIAEVSRITLLSQETVGKLEEERLKEVAHSNPIGQARKLFLEGKNAIAIASELPLSYEAVVDVFKGLLRENLVAGTAASPLKPESLETKAAPIQALAAIPMHDKKQIAKMAEGAAKGEVNLFAHLIPKAETKEGPQFVEEPFNDVHGVTHQQIALAAEGEEKTLDQAVEEGLIPAEIDVVEEKTLDEAIKEGLIPDTIEAVGDNEATLNHLAEQSSELTPLGEAVMDTLEQIKGQSDDELDVAGYVEKQSRVHMAKQLDQQFVKDAEEALDSASPTLEERVAKKIAVHAPLTKRQLMFLPYLLREAIDKEGSGLMMRKRVSAYFTHPVQQPADFISYGARMDKARRLLRKNRSTESVADSLRLPLFEVELLRAQILEDGPIGLELGGPNELFIGEADRKLYAQAVERINKTFPLTPVQLNQFGRGMGYEVAHDSFWFIANEEDEPRVYSRIIRLMTIYDASPLTIEAREAKVMHCFTQPLANKFIADECGVPLYRVLELHREFVDSAVSVSDGPTNLIVKGNPVEHLVENLQTKPLHFSNEEEAKAQALHDQSGVEPWKVHDNVVRFEGDNWRRTLGLQLKADAEQAVARVRPLIQTAEQEKEKERLTKELDAIFDHTTPHYGDKDGDIMVNEATVEQQQYDEQARQGDAILKSYMGYLTDVQYGKITSSREFKHELATSKAPMFDILHKISGTSPTDDLFSYYEYIAGRAIDAGDAPEFIANSKNIPLAIVLLMKEFKEIKVHDVIFKKHETAEEFVLRISRLKYTKSLHTKNAKMAFTGESVSSASEEELTPVSVPTKMSFGKKAVSVAVVRKHVEKMLQMMELSGNALIDVSISFSGGQHDEVE